METKFLAEISNLLEVDISELNKDFYLEKCDNWSSLSIVSTIALIDQYFQVSIPGREIEKCKTFGDLSQLIMSRST